MWRAIFSGRGGELDRVEARSEEDLKEALRDKLHSVGSDTWTLSAGDTITIEGPEE